jgi:PAS domain S-box-containing protein
MTLNFDKTSAAATRFTLLFCAVAALLIPFGYFMLSYNYSRGILETSAEINAEQASRLISNNPELWRFEVIRLEELLSRRSQEGAPEARRVFDNKNVLIIDNQVSLQSPKITVSHVLTDGGMVAGRIEVSRSILPLILRSSLVAIFGLIVGLILYRWLPFRAVIDANRKLQDVNAFLKKVMEGSTNSLVVLDLAGNIQMFNGRFEALTGSPREELQGIPFNRLFTGDARSYVKDTLDKVIAGSTGSVTFETELLRQHDLKLNLFCGAVPLFSDDKLSGVIVSLDDITDRMNLEEERLNLERQLQQTQKLESLGVLAGGIAHDFNNILTIIAGYCYVIKEGINPDSAHAEHLQKIENATNRAADLCRQMLSYAGKSEVQHSFFDLNSLVENMVKMLSSGIKKNVLIETDIADSQIINADSSQIQQIIMNLIINAAESIGDNNGTINISLKKAGFSAAHPEKDFFGRIIAPGPYICLDVSDNGCGMDNETMNRIFEPFFTTKFVGRGLGMSSTLGIIKSHDGALQLISRPGIGTNFKVYLPLCEGRDCFETAPVKVAPALAKGKGSILLVDDEEDLRLIGTIHLNKTGYSAITAANGIEALTIFREQEDKIKLIILDLLMPEMDGIETHKRIRKMSTSIPILFCSGCSKNEVSAEILEDGHTGFLQKPFDQISLQCALLEMLG